MKVTQLPHAIQSSSRRMRFVCALFLAVFGVFLLHAQDQVTNTEVTIWSEGTRLAGNLWQPSEQKDGKIPALLMVHGWGGTKNHLNRMYARQFSELGYVVLTFDYRGWGASEGKYMWVKEDKNTSDGYKEIREIVDPIEQLEDIRNALAFLLGESAVDPDRLAIWGTSLGGGLALQISGEFPQFKVLISQVGAVNSLGNFNHDPNFVQNTLTSHTARARGEVPPFPTSGVPGLRGAPDMFKFMRYDPLKFADSTQASTLILDAEGEELFDTSINGKLLYDRIKDRVEAKYVAVPGGHYAIYGGPGYEQALNETKAWLQKHL